MRDLRGPLASLAHPFDQGAWSHSMKKRRCAASLLVAHGCSRSWGSRAGSWLSRRKLIGRVGLPWVSRAIRSLSANSRPNWSPTIIAAACKPELCWVASCPVVAGSTEGQYTGHRAVTNFTKRNWPITISRVKSSGIASTKTIPISCRSTLHQQSHSCHHVREQRRTSAVAPSDAHVENLRKNSSAGGAGT